MFTLILIIAALHSHGASSSVISEQVDLIELNHYYDDHGRHAYDQVIFYEWSTDYCRREVVAWKLVENLPEYPRKQAGTFWVRWWDADARRTRLVTSRSYIETTSTLDPERAAKRLQDEKYRPGLLRSTVSILER